MQTTESSGGYSGTIVIDIEGVEKAAAVIADDAHAIAELSTRVAGHALPSMPPEVAGRVSSELTDVAAVLRSAPQTLLDAAQEYRTRAFWGRIADKLAAGTDLSGAELEEFKAAYASGMLTRYAEPWQADLAKAYADELHDREHPGGVMGFVKGVGDFFEGAWDAIKDPAVMIYHLTPFSDDWQQAWSDLGHGLAYGVTHPVEFGKAVINLDALQERGVAYWLGNLAPAAAATLLSGGAAAGVRGAEAAAAVDRVAEGAVALDRAAEGATALDRAAEGAVALERALPPVEEGMKVWRLHGWNEEAGGLRLVEGKVGAAGESIPSGSGPWGHSWTHVDPMTVDNPRAQLGLPTGPDGNPGRFLSEGVLRDTEGIRVREALPLDGQPGGWPELLVPEPERQIELVRMHGMNPQP